MRGTFITVHMKKIPKQNSPCDNCRCTRFSKLSRFPPLFSCALVMLTYLSNKYTLALLKRGQQKNAGKKNGSLLP